jgi:hypothetical protein
MGIVCIKCWTKTYDIYEFTLWKGKMTKEIKKIVGYGRNPFI